MNTITFEYKCRRCAAIHSGPCLGGQRDHRQATLMLMSATPDFRLAHAESKTISAFSLHDCGHGGTGIADLIGYAVES